MALSSANTTVIVNPAARGGWVRRNFAELTGRVRGVLGDVTFVTTSGPGEATGLARAAIAGGARTLVSFGGDGTLGEVAEGLLTSGVPTADLSLGVLHAGTGGDFRKILHSSERLEDACAVIRDSTPRAIDAGKVSFVTHDGETAEKYFLNITSLGMGGLVDQYVAAGSKRLGGKASYFLATLKATQTYTPAEVRLTVDGRDEGTFLISNICVCNGRFAGGGMHFAPQARLADGLFDIIVIRSASLLRSLPLAPKLYNGSHIHSPLVKVLRGAHIEVTPLTTAKAYMDIDGEAPGIAPATFDLLPQAIRVHGVREAVL